MARNHRDYRRIYEEHYLVKIPKGYHIHHIDGNHENNDPLNLECLSPADHAQKHEHMRNFVSVSKLASEKGGRIQGAKNKESGHWDRIFKLGSSKEAIEKRNKKCKLLGLGPYSAKSRAKCHATRPLREPRSNDQMRACGRDCAIKTGSTFNDVSHCATICKYSSWLNG